MWTVDLSTKRRRGAAAVCLAVASSAIAGCGFSINEAAVIKLSAIQATGNNLRVTQTMQFKTEAPVTWSVNGIPGGNAEVGTISSTGLYTAPAIVPVPNNQVTIGSSAEIYPSKGSYGVSVLNPIPIVTTITPGSFSEGMAQIVVNGSAFVYGAQILWNGTAVPTTYISGSQLVAVITENTPGTYPVTVVNPDPGSASSKSVNALVQPGQVMIQLRPSETSVRVNNTITITPTVTGSQNTALTWTVNGIAGGNAQIGTINAKGVYTAPAVVPNPNLVVVQATSVDNPSVDTIVNVQVLNPVPILLNATPSTVEYRCEPGRPDWWKFHQRRYGAREWCADTDAVQFSHPADGDGRSLCSGPFRFAGSQSRPRSRCLHRCSGAGAGYAADAAGFSPGCFALPDAGDVWRF